LGQSGTIETDARVALTTAQLQLTQWIYIERLRPQEAAPSGDGKEARKLPLGERLSQLKKSIMG
jgi:hypothetical protein